MTNNNPRQPKLSHENRLLLQRIEQSGGYLAYDDLSTADRQRITRMAKREHAPLVEETWAYPRYGFTLSPAGRAALLPADTQAAHGTTAAPFAVGQRVACMAAITFGGVVYRTGTVIAVTDKSTSEFPNSWSITLAEDLFGDIWEREPSFLSHYYDQPQPATDGDTSGFMNARGILAPADEPAEVTIRRLRDGADNTDPAAPQPDGAASPEPDGFRDKLTQDDIWQALKDAAYGVACDYCQGDYSEPYTEWDKATERLARFAIQNPDLFGTEALTAAAPPEPLRAGDVCVVEVGYAEYKYNQWPRVVNPIHDGDKVTIYSIPTDTDKLINVTTESDWTFLIPARYLRRVDGGGAR